MLTLAALFTPSAVQQPVQLGEGQVHVMEAAAGEQLRHEEEADEEAPGGGYKQQRLSSPSAVQQPVQLGEGQVHVMEAAAGEQLRQEEEADKEAPSGGYKQQLSSVSVMGSNVRGLRQAAGELSVVVQQHKPTFVVLTESHLNGDAIDAEMCPDGYKVVARYDRNQYGGGVVIFALDGLLVDTVDCSEWCVRETAEIAGFEVGDWALFGGYTQNSNTSPEIFAAFESIRTLKRFKDKKLMFFVDANCHHADWLGSKLTDEAGRVAKAFTDDYGMTQYIDFPTRGDNILDLFISDLEVDAQPLPPLGTSDHVNIIATVDLNMSMPSPPPGRVVYHWRTAPWHRIRGELKATLKGWKASSFGTVDEAVDDLYAIIDAAVGKYVKSSRPTKARPSPWWNRWCSRALRRKQRAFKVLRRDRSTAPQLHTPHSTLHTPQLHTPHSTLHTRYKTAVSELKKVERGAYAKHRKRLKKRLHQHRHEADWWHTVKLHAGVKTNRTAAAPDAGELADFFATKLSLDGQEDDDLPEFVVDRPGNLRTFRITLAKVRKVLSSLDPTKSVNGLSPRILKECSSELALPVTQLFKKIARLATWPTRWKTGRVSSIWKRKSKSLPQNYRPVTVLDNLSLAFERTVDTQLTEFIMLFVPPNQFGFRKHCGTNDLSAGLAADLHCTLDAELEAILVALDVAGAFDKVWWKGLLHKLQRCGCGGMALRLLKSYLSDRFLYVVAMGVASGLKQFYCGVPQGGIWSPKFWNFYIHDMFHHFKDSLLKGYADDLTVLLKFKQEDRMAAIKCLNGDLERVSRWGRKWKTTFEPTKTHAMLVSNTKDKAIHPGVDLLEFDGVKIGFESELKIVGVIYDHKLNWSRMASYVAGKGRQALGYLHRLGGLVDRDLSTIYSYFVRSRMEFGDTAYIGAAPTNLEPLDVVQRRAEKLSGKKFVSLSLRREADCFGFLCKLLSGRCLESVQEVFRDLKLEVDSRTGMCYTEDLKDNPMLVPVNDTRRPMSKIQVTNLTDTLRKSSLKTFRRSFIARVHDIFDRLPDQLKQNGLERGWMSIMEDGQNYIRNNYSTPDKKNRKVKRKLKDTSSTNDTMSPITVKYPYGFHPVHLKSIL